MQKKTKREKIGYADVIIQATSFDGKRTVKRSKVPIYRGPGPGDKADEQIRQYYLRKAAEAADLKRKRKAA